MSVQHGMALQQLQMYGAAPLHDMQLDDLECGAVDRMKVLLAGQDAYGRLVEQLLPLQGIQDAAEARMKDHVSHFVVRLALCRHAEGRAWLLESETDLFRYRVSMCDHTHIGAFLAHHHWVFKQVQPHEVHLLRTELMDLLPLCAPGATVVFFKVPFEHATQLLKTRRCHLQGGVAYVALHDMHLVASTVFRSSLAAGIARMARDHPEKEGDDRLDPILAGLLAMYTKHAPNNCSVTKHSGPLPTESFPPCMLLHHKTLLTTHRLTNTSRQQYMLFLKGIGVSMQDALTYWQAHDCTDRVKYNIRHAYGHEGKRLNYSPYKCTSIIGGCSSGCPFKTFDTASLRTYLQGTGVPNTVIADVGVLCASNRFQHACTRVFEAAHHVDKARHIVHPNGYFTASQACNAATQNDTAIIAHLEAMNA